MHCVHCERRDNAGKQNRVLRRELTNLQERIDQTFEALCADHAAEAMGELWASGEFHCGPQDYDFIVKRCLEAVREYNEYRTSPMSSVRSFCAVDRDFGFIGDNR